MKDPSIRLRNSIKEDNYFIVDRLLKRFPDLLDNIDPQNGWSNLHYSSYHDNFKITELLLKLIYERHHSSEPQDSLHSIPNSSARLKNTNSYYTQITSEDEIKLSFDKQTVIHAASEGDAIHSLPLLLSYFNVCIDQRDSKGYTASHICCLKGYAKCLNILLENGAYPNLQDSQGDTPLHLAFQYAHLNCLELLVKYKADDQLYNNQGWRPIDVAFDDDIITQYNSYKLNPTSISSPPTPPSPQQKYANTSSAVSSRSVSFLGEHNKYPSTVNTTNSAAIGIPLGLSNLSSSSLQNKITLPPIQSRKYSISSALSDDFDDSVYGMDGSDDQKSISTLSSRNTRNSSPLYKTTSDNSIRKTPSGNLISNLELNDTNTNLATLKLSRRPPPPTNGNFSISSPRRATISPTTNQSPNSKRSSMSTRTFRSNSQTSDPSPVKAQQYIQLNQQNTGSQSIKPGFPSSVINGSPKGLANRQPTSSACIPFPGSQQYFSMAPTSIRASLPKTYSASSEMDEATLKLSDFKSKNDDRIKLGLKLGNLIMNKSQEKLASDSSVQNTSDKNSMSPRHSEESVKSNEGFELPKKSRILSIPIASLRSKRVT